WARCRACTITSPRGVAPRTPRHALSLPLVSPVSARERSDRAAGADASAQARASDGVGESEGRSPSDKDATLRQLRMTRLPSVLVAITLAAGLVHARSDRVPAPPPELWRDVEVIRTAHGVPHIRAQNLRAAGYALAWVMSEDYGSRTGMRLLGARGELSRFEGRARLDADVENLHARARAIATYHLLDQETRDVYDGFAAGVNRYVELHPSEFPVGMPTDFSGYDVATADIGDPPAAARVRQFVAALTGPAPPVGRDFSPG